jgi:hypothetical protein
MINCPRCHNDLTKISRNFVCELCPRIEYAEWSDYWIICYKHFWNINSKYYTLKYNGKDKLDIYLFRKDEENPEMPDAFTIDIDPNDAKNILLKPEKELDEFVEHLMIFR